MAALHPRRADELAAVDDQVRAGDPARAGAGEEADHVGDVVRLQALDHRHRDEDDLPTTADIELRVQKMARRRIGRVRVTVVLSDEAAADDRKDDA